MPVKKRLKKNIEKDEDYTISMSEESSYQSNDDGANLFRRLLS